MSPETKAKVIDELQRINALASNPYWQQSRRWTIAEYATQALALIEQEDEWQKTCEQEPVTVTDSQAQKHDIRIVKVSDGFFIYCVPCRYESAVSVTEEGAKRLASDHINIWSHTRKEPAT